MTNVAQPTSYEAWKALALKELKDKAFEEYLHWQNYNGIELESWQMTLPTGHDRLPAPSGPWRIVEPILEHEAKAANEHALHALMSGAEAIWFQKGFLGAAAEVAAKSIDQNIAPVFFNGSNAVDPFRDLLQHNSEPDFKSAAQATYVLVDGLRLRQRGASETDEVFFMLSMGIDLLNAGIAPQKILFKSGFGSMYLSEIGKARALRLLWAGVLKEYGFAPESAAILGVNLGITYSLNDEYTNVLRATSAAMSAIIGGAQYVMITPWDRSWKEANAFSQRISRNIQVLLKEEARLDKNLNPADGSFFIEHLTHQMANHAWIAYQELNMSFSEFARSGQLKKMLELRANSLRHRIQQGQQTVLGVNKFAPKTVLPEPVVKRTAYALLPEALSLANLMIPTNA